MAELCCDVMLLTPSDCDDFGDIYATDWLFMCHGLNDTVCGFRTDPTDNRVLPLPAFPYDPGAQSDPLHAVAPAPHRISSPRAVD
jgi:hypothetical protein